MRLTITKKVNLLTICIIIVFTIALAVYFVSHENIILRTELNDRIESQLDNLKRNVEYPVMIRNTDALAKQVDSLLKQKDIIYCKVEDKAGKIMYENGVENFKAEKSTLTFATTITADYSQDESSEDIFFSESSTEEEVIGRIFLGVSTRNLNEKLSEVQKTIFLVTGFIIVLALIVNTFFLKYILADPIDKLVEGTKIISSGNLNHKVKIKNNDEIGYLADSFNDMATNIKKAQNGLEKKVKERTEDLEKAKNFSEEIFKASANGMILIDREKNVVRINDAGLSILGYEREDVLDKTCLDLFCEGKEGECPILDRDETLDMVEKEFTHKKGKKIPVLVNSSKIKRAGETFIIESFEDITEFKKKAEELKAVNKELDSFTYTISHDLKEPLRGIQTFSEFLMEDYRDQLDNEGKDYLKRIAASVTRMKNLIQDVLALSRISRIKNPYESVDPHKLIKEVRKRVRTLINEKNATVNVDDELPFVYCDKVKIKEVFYNLITNALKYNDKDKPVVEVDSTQDDEKTTFIIKDNGIGIEEKDFEEIFQIFNRLHARNDFGGGTGAGLTVVKKIIDEHGGDIWVESEKGEGTTFYFTIPKLDNKNENS
ncbi:MAG: ATP-binding protein [Elusimicrobiota bacterium]